MRFLKQKTRASLQTSRACKKFLWHLLNQANDARYIKTEIPFWVGTPVHANENEVTRIRNQFSVAIFFPERFSTLRMAHSDK